ncbi:YihY/virulence factor BrkB family protein, partial [Liquorilactobacillus ghanensis]
AIFPTIILIGNILPLLNIKAATILAYLESAVPKTIYHTLSPIILSFLDHGSGGLISVSALVALWAVSRGVNSLKQAFNDAYGVEDTQNVLMTRLFSLIITFLLLASLAIIIIAFSFGQLVLDYLAPILDISEKITGLFTQVKWPVTVLGLLFILGAMYFFLPNAKVHFWLTIPGTVLATITWIVLAQGFSIYVRYFARSVLSYGTLGTFIVLLFWLNYSGWVVILGAILNASLEMLVYHQIIPRKNRLKHYLIKKINSKKA